MADWRDNPKPTSVSRPVDVRSGTALVTVQLFAELDRLQGSVDYAKGRADALAELAQSDEWKAMVAWYGEGAWAVLPEWEALVKKVEGGQ